VKVSSPAADVALYYEQCSIPKPFSLIERKMTLADAVMREIKMAAKKTHKAAACRAGLSGPERQHWLDQPQTGPELGRFFLVC
jgi:hypothetical protein